MILQWRDKQWQAAHEGVLIDGGAQALQFGVGLFETMYTQGGTIEFLEAHYQRLLGSCEALNLSLDLDLEDIHRGLEGLRAQSSGDARVVKLSVHAQGASTVVLLSDRAFPYGQADLEPGIQLSLLQMKTHSSDDLLQHKTTNYWTHWRNRQKAQAEGVFDGLYLNERHVITEATAGNLFFKEGKALYTAPVTEGLLPGVMRGQVMKTVVNLGLKVVEVARSVSELASVETIYYTNSLVGCVEVKAIVCDAVPIWEKRPCEAEDPFRAQLIQALKLAQR